MIYLLKLITKHILAKIALNDSSLKEKSACRIFEELLGMNI